MRPWTYDASDACRTIALPGEFGLSRVEVIDVELEAQWLQYQLRFRRS